MDDKHKGFFFEFLFPKVIFNKGKDLLTERAYTKLAELSNQRYIDQDLTSFINDLKNECECNDGSCLFDQLFQIDGLIITECKSKQTKPTQPSQSIKKCIKTKATRLSQPIHINIESLLNQNSSIIPRKPYKYSFHPIDFSHLLSLPCSNCSSESSSTSLHLFQKGLKCLVFKITGTSTSKYKKLKLLKSFPESLNLSALLDLEPSGFSLTSLQFKSDSSTILLSYHKTWTRDDRKINLYEELESLFSNNFSLDSVLYTSQALQAPPPALHSRFWTYLLYEPKIINQAAK